MLLLSCHRRLRIISDALELRVNGGRVSHSWCMCVVSHGYGGLDGEEIEVVDGIHAEQIQGWSHDGRCRSTSRLRGSALKTPNQPVFQERSSR